MKDGELSCREADADADADADVDLLVKRAVVAGSDASQRVDTYRVELNPEGSLVFSTRNFLDAEITQLPLKPSLFPSQSLDLEWQ